MVAAQKEIKDCFSSEYGQTDQPDVLEFWMAFLITLTIPDDLFIPILYPDIRIARTA